MDNHNICISYYAIISHASDVPYRKICQCLLFQIKAYNHFDSLIFALYYVFQHHSVLFTMCFISFQSKRFDFKVQCVTGIN